MDITIKEETVGEGGLNFVEQEIAGDLAAGRTARTAQLLRFPPEPNGYLHIGHAKRSSWILEPPTNSAGPAISASTTPIPRKEDAGIRGRPSRRTSTGPGYDWGDRLICERLFPQAARPRRACRSKRKAYVDEQTQRTDRRTERTPRPGTESPFRNRPAEERSGSVPENELGSSTREPWCSVQRSTWRVTTCTSATRSCTASSRLPHWRTGDTWKVYPMYDFAHGQSDYFEGVTHSICTLEFVPPSALRIFRKELADDSYCPRQIEFNRLNLTYTVMSKRKLLQLVKEGAGERMGRSPHADDAARTRRRGIHPSSIKDFVNRIGYTKYEALNHIELLEHSLREDLNKTTTRVSVVRIR